MYRYLERTFLVIGFSMFVFALVFRSNAFAFMSFTVIGMTLIGIAELKNSIAKATSAFRIMKWLSVAPLGILIFLLLYISLISESIANNTLFGYCLFNVVFVATWIIGALVFDFNKVKAALLILNAIIITFLSISFVLYTIDTQHLAVILPHQIIPELKKIELTPSSFLELIFKIMTLPYVLASIWSIVILELRGMGMLKGKFRFTLTKQLHDVE